MSTEKIARFICQTAYEQIPNQAVELAKRCILDCLGCALAGGEEPGSKIIVECVKEEGGKEEAGVIGAGFKAPAHQAAWANGAMAHALDYDDADMSITSHPTSVLLPVVLALGEKLHLSGREALVAYLVGFEIEAKVGLACGIHHYELGWHNTATLGSIAAAAASAKLMKLSEEETRMALGIAASLAGGLRQNFGTMTKPLHAGNAARNGVVSGLLAKKGFSADKNILEAPFGFGKVLGGGADFDEEKMSQGLGSPFQIVSPGIDLKPYPSCRCTHWAIDAALDLRENYHITPTDIAEIECRTSSMVPKICIHSRPRNALEGKFSIEFCIAVALLDGEASLRQFTDERVADSKAQQLIPKTKYVHPPEFEEKVDTGEIVIKLQNGEIYSKKVDAAKGSPQNRLSWDELCRKYRDCAHEILPAKDTEHCLELVSNLESLENVTKLMDILTFAKDI